MRIEHIKYVDYNGTEREEDFLFNLTESELAEMELSRNGGIIIYLKRLVARQDIKNMSKFFKDILLKSYGEKSDDGRRFVKTKELATEFSQTEAYNVLFMKLVSDPKFTSEFISEVIPKKLVNSDEADQALRELTAKE